MRCSLTSVDLAMQIAFLHGVTAATQPKAFEEYTGDPGPPASPTALPPVTAICTGTAASSAPQLHTASSGGEVH